MLLIAAVTILTSRVTAEFANDETDQTTGPGASGRQGITARST